MQRRATCTWWEEYCGHLMPMTCRKENSRVARGTPKKRESVQGATEIFESEGGDGADLEIR